MIIPKIDFPIYGIVILLSIIIGLFYIFYNLYKDGYKNKQLFLYIIIYISFALTCGKMYTVFAYGESNIITAGISSYGGLVGVVVGAYIFERILPSEDRVIKYTILSLPLVYGFSKIACFIVGCCGGIPYEGIFKIKYLNGLNIWQFPIQIVETIVCLLIFVISHRLNNNKNINYIVLIVIAIFKFSLDFLRYDHINVLITPNQIFSIILLIITIIVFIKNRFIEE